MDVDPGVSGAAQAEEIARWSEVTDAAHRLASSWAEELASSLVEGQDDLVAGAFHDPERLSFTRQLLQALVDASDPFAAALGLSTAAREAPSSLPTKDRVALRVGGIASLGLPWAVLPVVRRVVRDRVSHLALATRLPTESEPLDLRRFAGTGDRGGRPPLTLSLTGDPVLGPAGAEREALRLAALAADPSVTTLAFDPLRLVAGGSEWTIDRDIETVAAALRPVFEAALERGTRLILEPRCYRGALIAPEVLPRLLAPEELDRSRTGLHLAAELPESGAALGRMLRLAATRAADGAEPIEVIIGVAGWGGTERITSILTGLPDPTLSDPVEQTAQALRLLDRALAAADDGARITVASEDPHVIAAALVLAEQHGQTIGVQLRAGVAPELHALLEAHGGTALRTIRSRLPLAPTDEFSGLAAEIIAILAEAADRGSALRRLMGLSGSERDTVLEAGRTALAAGARLAATAPSPVTHRTQRRDREWDPSERDSALFYRAPEDADRFDTGGLTAAVLGLRLEETGQLELTHTGPIRGLPVVSESGFANEPPTDAAQAANRAWVRALLARALALDDDHASETREPDPDLDEMRALARRWGGMRPRDRGTRLRRFALATVAARDRLIVALARETGAPAPVLDRAVSDAVDAARYLAQRTEALDVVRGAQFTADPLALVVCDDRSTFSGTAEMLAAALGAGSAVLAVVPSVSLPALRVLREEWEVAGLPEGLVRFVAADASVAAELARDTRVDRALVLGSRETLRAIVRARPGLRVEGRTLEPGAMAVTPNADLEVAIRDVIDSAFTVDVRDPGRVQALVLVGQIGRAHRFRDLLEDAVRGLRVGSTRSTDGDPLAYDVGPLPEPADDETRHALTGLDHGEQWLVQPEQLDTEGRLWRPGVRLGVTRESSFWRAAARVPVLGVMRARTLAEATDLLSAFGGTIAGIHTLDQEEALQFLVGTQAATLTVGRATTRTRAERQPSGVWDEAGTSLTPLIGGPNRLVALGSWRPREGTPSSTLHLRGLSPDVQRLIEVAQPRLDYATFDRLRRAALADELTWHTGLGSAADTIGLGVERNAVRRHPVPTHVRLSEDAPVWELIRVVAAALRAGAPFSVSTGQVLFDGLKTVLDGLDVAVALERDEQWLERIAVRPPDVDGIPAARIRLIGGDPTRTAEWIGGLDRVSLWAEPVTLAGPVELLAFLREQAISVSAHRFGMASSTEAIDRWLNDLGP